MSHGTRLPRVVAILLVGSALVTLSCQLLLGIDEPRGDARPDAAIEAAPPAPIDPCTHAYPAEKPAVDDDPATTRSFWFAADTIIVPYRPDAGVQPGVDLDESCTCLRDLHDGAPPCETPGPGNRMICDTDGGIDDSLGIMLERYVKDFPAFDPARSVNNHIATGRRTFLLYVKDYNGKANDTDVGVAFVQSGGLYTNLGCDGQPRDAGPPIAFPDAGEPGIRRAPVWDGCDRWSPTPGQVLGNHPNRVPIGTNAGYVANHTLVANIKDVALDVFGDSVKTGNAVVVAHLTPEGTGFRAEGFVAGRIGSADLINLVGRTPIESNGEMKPLCETSFWPAVAPQFCAARDVMESPSQDHTGLVCNAATATIGFTARQAQVSDDEFVNPTPPGNCNDHAECK